MSQIKELLIATHGADCEASESRVEQLAEASTRMGTDWLTIFLGTMFTGRWKD